MLHGCQLFGCVGAGCGAGCGTGCVSFTSGAGGFWVCSGPGLDDLSKGFDLSSYDLELERLELMERDQIQSTSVY